MNKKETEEFNNQIDMAFVRIAIAVLAVATWMEFLIIIAR